MTEDLAEKGKHILDEDDEKEEAERQATAKLFDVKALAQSTSKTYEINDEKLGVIRYGLLTSAEAETLKLEDAKSDIHRMHRIAYAMLKKADKTLTADDWAALPFDVKNVVAEQLARKLPTFLSPT